MHPISAAAGLPGLLQALGLTLGLAWSSFVLVKALRPMILRDRGPAWACLAGALGACHWPVQVALGSPLVFPAACSLLYLFSIVGLAPDDSVLQARATPASFWFQRGLVSALGGTLAGIAGACVL